MISISPLPPPAPNPTPFYCFCEFHFTFYSISKHDVRDKPAVNAKPEKEGLLKSNGEIKEESKTEIKSLFLGINDFFEEA